jgi:hypothetical protein
MVKEFRERRHLFRQFASIVLASFHLETRAMQDAGEPQAGMPALNFS